MGKVTFSRMTSGLAGDDRTQDVMVDGVVVGEIVASMADVGGACHQYVVGEYTLTLWGSEALGLDVDVEESFEVDVSRRVRDSAELTKTHGARAAHKRAKDAARAALSARRPAAR